MERINQFFVGCDHQMKEPSRATDLQMKVLE